MEQVEFLNGKTRLYGIVGDPIEQVRSPEMVTWEMHQRPMNAVLVPMHVREQDFDDVLPRLMQLHNLDGLIFTIPFKAKAIVLAQALGAQALQVGAINALARRGDQWHGEIFDGLGCVESFRRRGLSFKDKRVMLIGQGGAGSAIGAAIAAEHPALIRLFDQDTERSERLADLFGRVSPDTRVEISPPSIDGIDILLNACPVGMLDDARLPFPVSTLPSSLIVFDAIVKPEQTPLLALAQSCGCTVVRGREMMLGQISKIVDFFNGQN